MKILFVTTISNTPNAFLIPHIELLVKKGHQVDLAYRVVHKVDKRIEELGCLVHEIPFNRSPMSSDNREAYRAIRKAIKEGGYELVHTHTPIASFLTRMACRNLRDVRVVYTAHGFHFHKDSPLKNWAIYYSAEKLASRYTDLLLTINNEDYKRAKRLFKRTDVRYVPGVGIDTCKYEGVEVDRAEKLRSLRIAEHAFIVLSVGELNENKNHATVIRAIAELDDESIRYVICGEGPLESELVQLSVDLRVASQVYLLGQRDDLPEIYSIADVFVFPSRREGLGMVSLEAMASGLPLVTSNVHGIVDYSVDGVTGFSCEPRDVSGFAQGIWKLKQDEALRKRMGEHNREAVKAYNLDSVLKIMDEIYDEVIDGDIDG